MGRTIAHRLPDPSPNDHGSKDSVNDRHVGHWCTDAPSSKAAPDANTRRPPARPLRGACRRGTGDRPGTQHPQSARHAARGGEPAGADRRPRPRAVGGRRAPRQPEEADPEHRRRDPPGAPAAQNAPEDRGRGGLPVRHSRIRTRHLALQGRRAARADPSRIRGPRGSPRAAAGRARRMARTGPGRHARPSDRVARPRLGGGASLAAGAAVRRRTGTGRAPSSGATPPASASPPS
jgi:hypothetical protein